MSSTCEKTLATNRALNQRENANMPKKSALFDTDAVALQPFGVNVNDLVTTSLGQTATVLGVNYANKGDKDCGVLWVEYRGSYKAPVEKDGYKRQSDAAHVWREMNAHDKTRQANEEMQEKIKELNQRFRAGLLGDPKKRR